MSIANLFNSRRATRHLYARVVVVRHRSPRPHGPGPCTRPRDATGRRLLASRSYGCSEDELYNETRTHLSLDKMLRSVARSSDMRPLSLCRFCQDSIITYRRSRHSNFQPHSRRHPTSPRCPSAWQPNPGRRSTYRRGKVVQTTGTSSNPPVTRIKPPMEISLSSDDRPRLFAAFSLRLFSLAPCRPFRSTVFASGRITRLPLFFPVCRASPQ